MDDDELITAAAGGDDGALRVLYSRHAPWLASRLGRVLPAAAVEDVLQETFVAVWQGASRYRPDGRAGAWLWGIAKRQAALWLRRTGRPPLPPVDTIAPEDPESAAVDRVEIAEAVASLSDEEQRLWRLLFEQDRSVADVARRLGVPEGTVKSRAYRIRRLLRAALRQGGA
ncbi:RNA polymerase sigma factor [Amycolatopsis sp. CA-126428]|uniref:RNA polymerase sigma factor n=1 Tax=Amycolatopsis sp. CA-126428 TaxID=2073158 RepID=UPI000CD1E535|nr:sigma-70 family RNA polymerase sigma factor [Amycolatopsis sp. CA-126428]